MQNLGLQTEAQKNVNGTESRLLFLDKSIHCNAADFLFVGFLFQS